MAEVVGDYLAFLSPASNALELELTIVALEDVASAQRAAESLKGNQVLKALTISRNQLNPESTKALAEGLATCHLEKLRVNYNARMGVEGVEYIMNAVASNPQLQDFHFGDNELESEGCLIVCRTLESHPGIQHLNLSFGLSEMVSGGAAEVCGQALAQLLARNAQLESLQLTEDHLGAAAVTALAEAAGKHPKLRRLELNYNDLKDDGARAVASMLRNTSTLEILGLHANDIGAPGIEALCAALTVNRSVRSMDLRHNQCGDVGAPLGEAIRHSSVERWDLRSMRLGLASLTAIASSMGPQVKELDLGDNSPGAAFEVENFKAFASNLKGSNLEILQMQQFHQLPPSMEIAFAKLLENNLSLRQLLCSLDERSSSEACQIHLKAILNGSALESIAAGDLDEDVELLCKAITKGSKLHTVAARLTALPRLVEAVASPTSALKVLDLTSSQLLGQGAQLAQLLPQLTTLRLESCGLTESDAQHLADALAVADVAPGGLELVLAKNDLKDVGLKALASALRSNRSLHLLDVHETAMTNDGFNALVGSLQWNHQLQTLVFSGPVDDLSVLAEALRVNCGLQSLESRGDVVLGGQVQLLLESLQINCVLSSLELKHTTPKKLKKDEAYGRAMKSIAWLMARNSHPPLVLNSSFTKSPQGLQVCLSSLGGAEVLVLEVLEEDLLGSLIPRVFQHLGLLRPLRLLMADGRNWQELAMSKVKDFVPGGGYAQG